jgi:hypothetical protein
MYFIFKKNHHLDLSRDINGTSIPSYIPYICSASVCQLLKLSIDCGPRSSGISLQMS